MSLADQSVPSSPPARARGGLSPATRALLVAAGVAIVVAALRAAQFILVPFLLAGFLTILISPFYIALHNRKVPTSVTLLLFSALIILAGLLTVGILGTAAGDFAARLPEYQEELRSQIRLLNGQLRQWGLVLPEEEPPGLNENQVFDVLTGLFQIGAKLASDIFLVVLITVFALVEAPHMGTKIRTAMRASDRQWARAIRLLEDVRRYVALKTVMSLLTGALVYVWLLMMGVDYALVLGFLAFILNYIPNIGSFVASLPGILLALVDYGLVWGSITAVGYVMINVGVSNGLEPRFMGKRLGLSPLVIVVALIFWGWVLGPIGLLLAIPLTRTVKIVCENFSDTRWVAVLLGPEVTTLPAPLQQDHPPEDQRSLVP